MDLESTRDLPQDSERFFPIGSNDNYPGDESEGHSYERIPDHGDEEEGLSYIRIC